MSERYQVRTDRNNNYYIRDTKALRSLAEKYVTRDAALEIAKAKNASVKRGREHIQQINQDADWNF